MDFRAALLGLVKKQVLKYIVSKLPIFSGTLLNPLLGLIIGKILDIAFEKTDLAIYMIKIDAEVKNQVDKVNESKDALEKAVTDEEKKKAQDEYKKRIADLINLKPK